MTQIIDLLTDSKLIPTPQDVLKQMGVPKQRIKKGRSYTLAEQAITLFSDCLEAKGLCAEISQKEFAGIYKGQGENAKDTPLEHIFRQADNLALFALTLGAKVSEKIAQLFISGNAVLGSMLDATASVAADKGSEICEQYFFDFLLKRKQLTRDQCVVAYSPGYCGWHVSGQKKLFVLLKQGR